MRTIVDAHHHLWDLDACDYPWLMARGVRRFFGDPTPIQKNYLVSDLRADAGDYVIDASVHIQVGVAPGDEVVLLGAQGDEEIDADEWANRLDSVSWEILCGFGPRLPRRYRR